MFLLQATEALVYITYITEVFAKGQHLWIMRKEFVEIMIEDLVSVERGGMFFVFRFHSLYM